MVIQSLLSRIGWNEYRSFRAYEQYLTKCLRAHPNDRAMGFALAIGAISMETYRSQGDGHVEVLRHHGLRDGMNIFDLGCGCGRTAEALVRSGWAGSYTGTDVIERFVAEVRNRCPGYQAFRHRSASIPAPDGSLDMLYHWSVFPTYPLKSAIYTCRMVFAPSSRAVRQFFPFSS